MKDIAGPARFSVAAPRPRAIEEEHERQWHGPGRHVSQATLRELASFQGTMADPGRELVGLPAPSQLLPSSFRLAFDGSNLAIMAAGVRHEMFGRLMKFAEAIMDHHRIDHFPAGRTTWQRPEIDRGIEADACFLLDPTRLEIAGSTYACRSNDVTNRPSPDLVVVVDISRSSVWSVIGGWSGMVLRMLTDRWRPFGLFSPTQSMPTSPGEATNPSSRPGSRVH